METTTQESQAEQMDAVEIVDALIELIEFNFDGYYGYTTAAKNVENDQYKQILETHGQQRLDFTYELNKLISKYGHEPIDGGHIIGKLHRAWMEIKAAVAEDDYAILYECAQAEEIVMKTYQTVMDLPLPDHVRDVVRHQMSETRVTTKKIQDLVAILKQQQPD